MTENIEFVIKFFVKLKIELYYLLTYSLYVLYVLYILREPMLFCAK